MSGWPRPEVVWFRDGMELRNGLGSPPKYSITSEPGASGKQILMLPSGSSETSQLFNLGAKQVLRLLALGSFQVSAFCMLELENQFSAWFSRTHTIPRDVISSSSSRGRLLIIDIGRYPPTGDPQRLLLRRRRLSPALRKRCRHRQGRLRAVRRLPGYYPFCHSFCAVPRFLPQYTSWSVNGTRFQSGVKFFVRSVVGVDLERISGIVVHTVDWPSLLCDHPLDLGNQ